VNEVEKEHAIFTQGLMNEAQQKTTELTNALDLLTQSYDDTLEALGSALDLKDPETEGHSQRVSAYTISIAKNVPVPLPYLTALARAAFLHDIGKIAIPEKILRKPGALDDAEKVIMRTHCEIGYNMHAHSVSARRRRDRPRAPGILRWRRLSSQLAR
jgi:HD-GYP domain-containing protein (c-di-GMP phosphodiesterase class II)